MAAIHPNKEDWPMQTVSKK